MRRALVIPMFLLAAFVFSGREAHAGDQEIEFPSFGMALTPPEGWQQHSWNIILRVEGNEQYLLVRGVRCSPRSQTRRVSSHRDQE